jgi:WD40 repeat protein
MGADAGGNNEDIDPRQEQYVPIKAYGEHKRAVSAVKVAPSALTKQGKILVASASADATVKIWDLGASSHYFAQGQATLPAKASHLFGSNHYTVLTSTSPKNSEVAESTEEPQGSPTSSSSILLSSVQTCFGHGRGINDVCWNACPASPLLATASDDKTCRIWDAVTGDALVELRGHDHFVFCVDINTRSGNNLVASGSFDETVKLWDIRSGDCVSTIPAHSDPVSSISINRDGTCIATASHDGLIRIWDISTGECLKTIFAANNPPVSAVRYTPNSKYLLAATLDSTMRLWPVVAYHHHTGMVASFANNAATVSNNRRSGAAAAASAATSATTAASKSTPMGPFTSDYSTATSRGSALCARTYSDPNAPPPVLTSSSMNSNDDNVGNDSQRTKKGGAGRRAGSFRQQQPPNSTANPAEDEVQVTKKARLAAPPISKAVHRNSKYSIAIDFTCDGQIVTGSETGHIVIYDTNEGSIRQSWYHHNYSVDGDGVDEGNAAGDAGTSSFPPEPVLAVGSHDSLPFLASGGMTQDRRVRFWCHPSLLTF